ncbi:MAG: hypothetical protein LBH19_12130 [Dysgonamonadaceae bacterium]|jgi:hypothetical protein|nr:hypothetical protein [Dysgonamonadaceae bacterium]
MKQFIYFIISLIIIVCFACNKTSLNEKQIYNGIDTHILNIIDSIQICNMEEPFVTIWFSDCNEKDYVVRFFEGVLIPPPPMPPAPNRRILISEGDGFQGYKKYKDVYLVFLKYDSTEYFEKFVNKDSLCFGEEPFTHFNVYEFHRKHFDCKPIKQKYLINANDSLILYEGKCLFDLE